MGTIICRFLFLWLGIFIVTLVIAIVRNHELVLAYISSSMGEFVGVAAVILIMIVGIWFLFHRW